MTHFVFVNQPMSCWTAHRVAQVPRGGEHGASCGRPFSRLHSAVPADGLELSATVISVIACLSFAGGERKKGAFKDFFRRNCKKNSGSLFDVPHECFYLCDYSFFSSSKWGRMGVCPSSFTPSAFIRRHQHPSVWNETQRRSFSLTSGSCRPPRKHDVICFTLDPASRQSIP